jgi:hypothetical protein
MGIRAEAAIHAKAFLEDSASGFGWPLALTSPAGVELALTGYPADVSETVDPETGVAVSGRRSSVSVSLLSLSELPVGVTERSRRPWLVTMADATGDVATWKVVDVRPDRTLAVVVLYLEAYRAGPD